MSDEDQGDNTIDENDPSGSKLELFGPWEQRLAFDLPGPLPLPPDLFSTVH